RTRNGQRGVYLSDARSAGWQAGDLLKPCPQIEKSGVAKGRRNQRNSERQTGLAKSGRESNHGEIEQVRKARVEPEIAVEVQRLGRHCGGFVDCAGGGQQQNIDL